MKTPTCPASLIANNSNPTERSIYVASPDSSDIAWRRCGVKRHQCRAPYAKRLVAVAMAVLVFLGWSALHANALTVNIDSPTDGTNLVTTITNAATISISASSTFNITNLVLLVNDVVVRSFNPPAGQTSISASFPVYLPSETADTFTVVAKDANGDTVTSSPVTVNVSFAAPAAAPTGAMVLWLSADVGVTFDPNDGQSITNWADQSGLGNDARQTTVANAPLLRNAIQIGGAYVARFNVLDTGASRYMIVSNSPSLSKLTTNFTFLTVASENDSGATYAIISKTSGAYLPNPFRWHWNAGGAIGIDLGAGAATIVNNSGVTTPAGNFSILGARAGNNVVGQTMNFTNGPTTTLGAAAIADAGTVLNIGQGASQFTGMYGNIAEIICYSNRLSDSDYLLAQTYLETKYMPTRIVVLLAPVAPAVTLTTPTNGQTFDTLTNGTVHFTASVTSSNPLYTVSYFLNGALVGTSNIFSQTPPYQFDLQATQPGSVSLTTVVADNLGVSGTSAPVVVTITGPPLTPPSSGLSLWLKPGSSMITNASGQIIEWDDQSGKTNNALQAFPANAPALAPNAINGYSVAYFNQLTNVNPQYLDVASASNIQRTAFSVLAVAKPQNQSGNYDIISKTATGSSAPFPFDWRYVPGGSTEMDVGAGGSVAASNISSLVPSAGNFNVLSVLVGGGSIKQYVGYTPSTITTLGSAAIADGATAMRVGNRGSLDANMLGYTAEILWYDHVLTDAERLTAVGYLANKYALSYASFSNAPPSVGINSPTNGTAVTAGANVTMSVSASANAVGGYLTRLDFLANGTVISSVTLSNQSVVDTYIINLATSGSYSLTVRATDNYGFQTTSSAVTVTASGFVAPSAPPTNGMVVWLNASVGITTDIAGPSGNELAITNWADQSGHGNDARQTTVPNAPWFRTNVFNGLPAARFNVLDAGGTSRWLTISNNPSLNNLTTNFTFLAVARENDQGANYAIFSETTGAYLPNPFRWHFNGGGAIGIDLGAGGSPTVVNNSASAAGLVAVLGARAGGGTLNASVNLAESAPTAIGAAAVADAGVDLNIGQGAASNLGLYGNLAEFIVYSNRLSNADFVQANAYLGSRYGITMAAFAQPGTGAPTLSVAKSANNIVLSWPLNFSGYTLESKTNLSAGSWNPIVTSPPNNQVILPASAGAQFFRLRQ